jgi:hypothetical protein
MGWGEGESIVDVPILEIVRFSDDNKSPKVNLKELK